MAGGAVASEERSSLDSTVLLSGVGEEKGYMQTVLALTAPTRPGWYSLKYKFSREINEILKLIPGVYFDMAAKTWFAPWHAISSIDAELHAHGLGKVSWTRPQPTNIPKPALWDIARSYQQNAITAALCYTGSFLCQFDMRTGKTLVGISTLWSVLQNNWANTGVVFYPSLATDEWRRQWAKFNVDIPLFTSSGTHAFVPDDVEKLCGLPRLVIGVAYELILSNSDQWKSIQAVLERRGKWYVVADELHSVQNRKAGRTAEAKKVAHHKDCIGRLGLTGTPLRNRTVNAYSVLDFVYPKQWGSFSKFTKRYSNGHMGDYGWVADGKSNEEELARRLSECSLRVTRQEAAPWLPPGERVVHRVELSKEQRETYLRMESATALQVRSILNDKGSSSRALEKLVVALGAAKVEKMNERIQSYIDDKKKLVAAALYHETLHKLIEAKPKDAIAFLAPGWFSREKREANIEAWRQHNGPAILYVNILSTGMAIDLSDAEASVSAEVPWVPADFQQFEARLHEVHLGKRKTPPIHEYILAKGTVDEAMAMKLLEKMAVISTVVGSDRETRNAQIALQGSGVVNSELVGLGTTDASAVSEVLGSLVDKWAKGLAGALDVSGVGVDGDENRGIGDSGDEVDEDDRERDDV